MTDRYSIRPEGHPANDPDEFLTPGATAADFDEAVAVAGTSGSWGIRYVRRVAGTFVETFAATVVDGKIIWPRLSSQPRPRSA